MIVRVAALLLAATVASAQVAEAPARPSPVRQALVESLGPGSPASDKSAPFESLVSAMTPEIRATAKARLDALDRAPLSASALEDLSKAYSLLGSHASAAEAGLALQTRDPKSTKGLVLASSAKLDEGDYAGSVALAEQALKIDPKDPAALAVLHTAKGRVAPMTRSMKSQLAKMNSSGPVEIPDSDLRPVKLGVTKPTMGKVPDIKTDSSGEHAPSGRPWLPYAIGFGLTVFGVGLAIKHSLEDAKGAVVQAADKAEDGAANLYFKGKDWAQEHPKTTIAAGVGAVVVAGGLLLSGGALGGGGMMLATASGPMTATAMAESVGIAHVTAAGATVALMSATEGGSSSKPTAGNEQPSSDQPKPDVENVRWDPVKKRWVDDEWVYKWDRAIHDKRGGQPHWDRGNIRTGRQEWSPDGKTWIRK